MEEYAHLKKLIKKLKKYNFRKLIIKNYIAFYRVDENKKLVNVDRILYNKMNWKNIL